MSDQCPKCCLTGAMAAPLTKRTAQKMMRDTADAYMRLRPGLPKDEAEAIAMQAIMARDPKLLLTCVACGEEWVA